jgi:hypothetical protein
MDLTSKTEEKILCIWAKVILIVGIIEGACALIIGIVYAINEESFLYFVLSIVVAALLAIPFILMWATVRVLAKMSLNSSNTDSTIYRLTTIVETYFKKKTDSIQHTDVNSRPNNNPKISSKQTTVQNNKSEKTQVPLASVLNIVDEINKQGGGEADKLCRLMEMRDDGTISDEIYDAVLQKIS